MRKHYGSYIIGALTVTLLTVGGYAGYRYIIKETEVEDSMGEISHIDHEAHEVSVDEAIVSSGMKLADPGDRPERQVIKQPPVSINAMFGNRSAFEIAQAARQNNPALRNRAEEPEKKKEEKKEENTQKTDAQPDRTGTVTETTEYNDNSVEWYDTKEKYNILPELNLAFDTYARTIGSNKKPATGVNQFGMGDTSGEGSIAAVMNSIFGTDAYTENNVLAKTIESNNCSGTGAMIPEQVMTVVEGMGQLTGDSVATEVSKGQGIPRSDELGWLLSQGGKAIVPLSLYQGADGTTMVMWAALTGIENNIFGTGFKVYSPGEGREYTINPQDLYNRFNSLGTEPAVICVLPYEQSGGNFYGN